MALEHTPKTNNKHTCQILAAAVKYIWISLREAEHMHNYANMLIGFQQPSYSRWICTSRVLPVTHRATRSGLSYVRMLPQCPQQQMPRHAGCSAVARMVETGLAGINKEDKPDTGQSTATGMRTPLIWPSVGDAGQLSALDPSGCSVHRAEMFGTGLRQQLNTKTEMCDCEM